MNPAQNEQKFCSLGWIIYVMVAPISADSAYLKIGISSDIPKRIAAVQTGCPIQIKEILYHKALSRESARAVERAMHADLDGFRVSGEWFRFALDDQDHKAAFNSALRLATARNPDMDWKWNKVKVPELRAAVIASDPVLVSAESRRKSRQLHRLANGRAY